MKKFKGVIQIKNIFVSRYDFRRWALDTTFILKTSNSTGEKITEIQLINSHAKK